MNPRRRALGLVASLALTALAPIIGNAATGAGLRDWYPRLAKPGWTPPPWLFGPVWTALYIAMAVAAWLVWARGRSAPDPSLRRWARAGLALYALQLALNAAWSVLFFGLRSPGLALAEILALWAAILATTVAFARVHRAAAGLMVPYLGWLTFAAALNLAIWRLNTPA